MKIALSFVIRGTITAAKLEQEYGRPHQLSRAFGRNPVVKQFPGIVISVCVSVMLEFQISAFYAKFL